MARGKFPHPAIPYDIVEEYLNELNEDHSLEMVSKCNLYKMVSSRFNKNHSTKTNYTRESIMNSVVVWMDEHTMPAEAMRKTIFMMTCKQPVSEETRAKLRAAHLGKPCPWNRRKLSAEHRMKMSNSHKGKTWQFSETGKRVYNNQIDYSVIEDLI